MLSDIEQFLQKHSGKIVAVGDTFDFYRSSMLGENSSEYLARTAKYWTHISDFVIGNHDAKFLEEYRDMFNPVRIYKNGPVIALHGHQLRAKFDKVCILRNEKMWHTKIAKKSIFWDIEEWICKKLNKYFTMVGDRAYNQALKTIKELLDKGLLDKRVRVIITGHTHLPFDVRVYCYPKNRWYRVINCGSTLHSKVFNPIYIEEIDKYFVSDLHLGTNKSILNPMGES